MCVAEYTNRKRELYFGRKFQIYIIIGILKIVILFKFWKIKCMLLQVIIKNKYLKHICNIIMHCIYIKISCQTAKFLPSHRWSNTGPIDVLTEFVRLQSFLVHDSKQLSFAFILQSISLLLNLLNAWNSEIMCMFMISTQNINVKIKCFLN